jgi:hypothetical protein
MNTGWALNNSFKSNLSDLVKTNDQPEGFDEYPAAKETRSARHEVANVIFVKSTGNTNINSIADRSIQVYEIGGAQAF